MPIKRTGKRLVIDTDVASSASEKENPRSINCRQALEKIQEKQFRVIITDDLQREWNKHRSRFFRRWLTSMFAQKLQVVLHSDTIINDTLRTAIKSQAQSDKDSEAMLKDVHLLEAALASDETIVSMNNSDRDRFKQVSEQITMIRNIVWVNPDAPEEKCLDWLDEGAPADDFRILGYLDDD